MPVEALIIVALISPFLHVLLVKLTTFCSSWLDDRKAFLSCLVYIISWLDSLLKQELLCWPTYFLFVLFQSCMTPLWGKSAPLGPFSIHLQSFHSIQGISMSSICNYHLQVLVHDFGYLFGFLTLFIVITTQIYKTSKF